MSRFCAPGYYPWIPKILPLVYNDALSYLENVYALIDWCNTLKAEIETSYTSLQKLIEQAEKNSNDYTDKQLENFRVEFDALQTDLQKQITELIAETETAIKMLEQELDEKQKELEQKLDAEIEELKEFTEQTKQEINAELIRFEKEISDSVNQAQHDIAELWIAFNKYRVQVNDYVDFKCEELKGFVEAHTALRNGNNILVYNPVKADTDTLRNTLDDLYNYQDYGAITVEEYANMGLTVQEYAGRGLTVHQYAYEARFFFFEEIYFRKFYERLAEFMTYVNNSLAEMEKRFYMQSPLTGKTELIETVVTDLAGYHLNTLTVQEYADKEWTVQEYADMQWTVREYAESSAGLLGRLLGGDAEVVQLIDDTKDIVNNVMDSISAMPRARPIIITVQASDGLAIGNGFLVNSQGVFLLANGSDAIRMVYNNGAWTTTRI